MSVFNTDSFHEGMPTELDLFSLPPTQTAVEEIRYEEIRPLSQVTPDRPIEFKLSGQGSLEYLDMRGSTLHVKLRVLNADGSVLDPADKTGPSNLFLQSLFSTTEVTLQNKATITRTYNPYIAMIQTLLNYGEDAKSSQLSSQLFIKDDNDKPDDTDAFTGANNGLFLRRAYMSGSKIVDLEGPIYHDLFTLQRYLLNQIDVKLKLHRSNNAFSLCSGEASPDYKIDIIDIYLLVKKIKVNPAVIYGHAELLKNNHAKYFFTRSECRVQSIASGSTSFHWENLFQGQRPNRLVVAFVQSSAVNGDYKSNPFNFLNCSIQSICLYIDGVSIGPWKLDFNAKNGLSTLRAYTSLFKAIGTWNENKGNFISRADFANGTTLFAFQLEPNFSQHGQYLSLVKTGNVRLEVQFGKALQETTSCIVYSESGGYFEIDAVRNILTE